MSSQKLRIWTKSSKKKGRVVPRGDVVKDDSGSYAVFTERGSSASHMTAKVLDVITRLPGCAGQASDAVWACTHGRRAKTIGMTRIRVPNYLDSSTTIPMARIVGENSRLPLERNVYGHPFAGLLWGTTV